MNVLFIHRALQIAAAASTHASVCASHPQWCLAPLPLDRRASGYFENAKRFLGVQDRSIGQPHLTISNCARGLKRRVVCISFRCCGSLVSSCSCAASSGGFARMLTRCDPLESMVCFKREATADLTCCGVWVPSHHEVQLRALRKAASNAAQGYRRNDSYSLGTLSLLPRYLRGGRYRIPAVPIKVIRCKARLALIFLTG
jgi:hypothetical protein